MEKKENRMEPEFRIPTVAEMERKWDRMIALNPDDVENWTVWKNAAIRGFRQGYEIPYYGFCGEDIICEATAKVGDGPTWDEATPWDGTGLLDEHTAYLFAFRTEDKYQGQGYFTGVYKFMEKDLIRRGYTAFTLGVDPEEKKNLGIYTHYGFTELVKTGEVIYPDGSVLTVEYYKKTL